MKISEFINLTKFSIKRIIDMEKMNVEHFVQANKESDLDHLTEQVYKDMIAYLNGRLKLVRRFTKKSEAIGEEVSTAYIASGAEIASLLDSFKNLTDTQKEQAIEFFKKK